MKIISKHEAAGLNHLDIYHAHHEATTPARKPLNVILVDLNRVQCFGIK